MTERNHRGSISTAYEEQVGNSNPILALLRRYLPEHGSIFGIAVFSTVLWRIMRLIPPYLLGVTIDTFFSADRAPLSIPFVPHAWIPPAAKGQFAFLLGLFVSVFLGRRILQVIWILSWRWFQQSVLHELRQDTYDATQRLRMSFFENERTGDVMSILNNDINQLEGLFNQGLQNTIHQGVFLISILVVMLALHWQLTLVITLFVVLLLAVTYVNQAVIEPRYDARREAVGTLNAHLQNVITGIETVKACTTEAYERSRLARNSRGYWRTDWYAARLNSIFQPVSALVTDAALVAVVIVGGWWALFGPPFGIGASLSVGTFITFYFYGQMFIMTATQINGIVDTYTDAKSSAKRVFGLIHHPSTVPEADDTRQLESVDGQIEYRDVTFTYPDGDGPALKDVTFAASPGDFIGLVGPTGAGKSTVLKLLLRFYDPDTGTITVDRTKIEDVSVERLRQAIGYVSQDPFLFDGTISENIAYGDEDADTDAIVAAAKSANAHEFVIDLPEGYDTAVGERGVKLSGGQCQRIAIARTILKDPDVLILDEATSHVDNQTELLIQESFAALIAGRTTFTVAHRLSTVRHADTILVFDDGEIIEQGTHEELRAQDGLYAELWKIHVGSADSITNTTIQQMSSAE